MKAKCVNLFSRIFYFFSRMIMIFSIPPVMLVNRWRYSVPISFSIHYNFHDMKSKCNVQEVHRLGYYEKVITYNVSHPIFNLSQLLPCSNLTRFLEQWTVYFPNLPKVIENVISPCLITCLIHFFKLFSPKETLFLMKIGDF